MYFVDIKNNTMNTVNSFGPFIDIEDAKNTRLVKRWLLKDEEYVDLRFEKNGIPLKITENFLVTATASPIKINGEQQFQICIRNIEPEENEPNFGAIYHEYSNVDQEWFYYLLFCFPSNILLKENIDAKVAKDDLLKTTNKIFEYLLKKLQSKQRHNPECKYLYVENFNNIVLKFCQGVLKSQFHTR